MNKFIIFISFLGISFSPLFSQEKLIQPESFKASNEALESIKLIEAYRDYVYYDNNENLIFGYGHLVWEETEAEELRSNFGYETILESGERKVIPATKKMSDSNKKKFVEELFLKDVTTVETFMKENITVPLKQNQIDAIVIYLFWRGGNPMNPDVGEFYELVNKKSTNAIKDFMINRPKSDKNYLPGLVTRNTNTAELFMTGVFLFN